MFALRPIVHYLVLRLHCQSLFILRLRLVFLAAMTIDRIGWLESGDDLLCFGYGSKRWFTCCIDAVDSRLEK